MNLERNQLPIVVVDIDNTVANQNLRIIRSINNDGKVNLKKVNSPEEVILDEVIEGSREALKIISKEHQIFWLTARKEHLTEVTHKWLTSHKFPIDNLVLVERFSDKLYYLEKWAPKLFIDDLEYDHFSLSPKKATIMIENLSKKNINFYKFEGCWNDILAFLTID